MNDISNSVFADEHEGLITEEANFQMYFSLETFTLFKRRFVVLNKVKNSIKNTGGSLPLRSGSDEHAAVKWI